MSCIVVPWVDEVSFQAYLLGTFTCEALSSLFRRQKQSEV
jgi:hypothetical protein